MTRLPALLWATALCGGALFVPQAARAEDVAAAAVYYDAGAAAYDRGEFPVAAARLARADEHAPNPRALQLAMAAALRASDPGLGMELADRAERRAVDGSLAILAAKLRQRFASEAGRIRLTCPNGIACRATVEERTILGGATGFVSPGPRQVRVEAEGRGALTVQVNVGPGATFVLAPTSAELPALTPPLARRAPVAPPTSPSAGLSPAFFASAAALTAVAAGASVALTAATKARHDAFVAEPSRASSDAGKDAQTAARIAWGATGALAVTTVALAFFTRFGGAREPSVALGVAPGALTVTGTFR
ncbi:MAG TPA: hypothetical protein PLR99_28410 [Polyangiaceae bacterium]|nr:hypothetical protein [Polyangiaceae bacterium]